MKRTSPKSTEPDQAFTVDMTLPRRRRPLIGLDIEDWRAELGLSKFDAQHALGFRNSIHYNKACSLPLLPFELELLIRLYEDNPTARGWEVYSPAELFDIMYSAELSVFKGTPYERYAAVDLGSRFTKLFGRSTARRYAWLDASSTGRTKEIKAYAGIECILGKLHQVANPRETLERISKHVWSLRGVDFEAQYPVPTLANPPSRVATGRKTKEHMEALRTGKELPPPKPRRFYASKKEAAGQSLAPGAKVKSAPTKAPKKAVAVATKKAPAAKRANVKVKQASKK